MPLVRPFRALRARAEVAASVAAPPYDVMSASEARKMAAKLPDSFLHVSRPEIDLPAGTDPHGDEAYAQAQSSFERLQKDGLLVRDTEPMLYVYRLTMGAHAQTGIAAEVSCEAYIDGRVKKHEFTRPDKEDDRTRHVLAVEANTGPVFLVHRSDDALNRLVAEIQESLPEVDFVAPDGVRHEIWPVAADALLAQMVDRIEAAGDLYIADGHHRCAAGARACEAMREKHGDVPEAPWNYFFGVIFPDDQVQVFDYNRVVEDLGGYDVDTFKSALGEAFAVAPARKAVRPDHRHIYGMYLNGEWYRLEIDPKLVDKNDPVGRLDVGLLQTHVLERLLGIEDPRRDPRISFVGGIRGLEELERRVDALERGVAFSLYPTELEDVMGVADAGQVMPPKSTWFEPKLRDGLIVQLLQDA